MSARTKVAALLICLLVAAGAGYRLIRNRTDGKADPARVPSAAARTAGRLVNVSVTEAKTGQVRDELEITGVLKPKEQVDVSSKVTGRLLHVSGQVGDPIRKGQTIAEVESTELAEQVRRSEAVLAIAKATLDQRRAELKSSDADLRRAKQLFDVGLVATQDYEAKRTAQQVLQAQVSLARAQVDQAAAELRELRIRMAQMRITSPVDGYIAQKFLESGAVVSPATPVVRVVNISTLTAQANVPERQITKLRVGTRAVVRVDALGDVPLDGTVARIGPVLDAATRTALVEIEIPNRSGLLRAEMFARVTLDVPNMRKAVLIPRDALVYRGNTSGVYVVQEKRPAFRPVETGVTQGQHVEVLGNLSAGTTVVSRGASLLDDGDQIRIVDQTEAEFNPNDPAPSKAL